MNSITTVEKLAEILDDIDSCDHAKTMKRIDIPVHEFESYATWSEKCYTRNCLARSNKYELILLCWDIGAKAPVHGHGGEDCWVYQVKGTVEEKRYECNDGDLIETNKMTLFPGRLTYMHDRMGYHAIENISNERAMTLHIYALPIDSCEVYNSKKECFELKDMAYDTFKECEEDSLVL